MLDAQNMTPWTNDKAGLEKLLNALLTIDLTCKFNMAFNQKPFLTAIEQAYLDGIIIKVKNAIFDLEVGA